MHTIIIILILHKIIVKHNELYSFHIPQLLWSFCLVNYTCQYSVASCLLPTPATPLYKFRTLHFNSPHHLNPNFPHFYSHSPINLRSLWLDLPFSTHSSLPSSLLFSLLWLKLRLRSSDRLRRRHLTPVLLSHCRLRVCWLELLSSYVFSLSSGTRNLI